MSPQHFTLRRLGHSLSLVIATALSTTEGSAADPSPTTAKNNRALDAAPVIQGAPSELQDPEVMVLKRGVVLNVAQDSRADVQFVSKLPIGPRNELISVQNVHVSRGRVDGIAPSNGSAGVLLLGPGGVQGVTAHGRITMIVGADQITVAAIGGEALVGRSGALKTLPANTVRTFDLRVERFTDRAALAAPSDVSSGLGLSLGGEAPVALHVNNGEPAASYCGFLFNADGQTVARKCGQTDQHNIQLMAPSAGAYWGSVAAVDAEGLAGALSQPIPVRILGIQTGQEIKNGSVFLDAGQRLELVGYEGLMMSYGASPEFSPATSTVKVRDHKPTLIAFRNPKQPTDLVLLNLSPRVLKSRIDIGPSHSTWPQDDIKISVKMWDGQGQPLEDLSEYQVVARVGLTPVDVAFTQEGSALIGVLSPQAGPGPWVVRVSVLDARGNELNRDFLEVATPPQPKPSATTANTPRSPKKTSPALARR